MVYSIDVGGYVYSTTVETLKKSALILSVMQLRNEQGCVDQEPIFIDRDGASFNFILNFLRTGVICASSAQQARLLILEADYFKLPDAVQQLQTQLEKLCD